MLPDRVFGYEGLTGRTQLGQSVNTGHKKPPCHGVRELGSCSSINRKEQRIPSGLDRLAEP
jgi:hypothetical protein